MVHAIILCPSVQHRLIAVLADLGQPTSMMRSSLLQLFLGGRGAVQHTKAYIAYIGSILLAAMRQTFGDVSIDSIGVHADFLDPFRVHCLVFFPI